MAHNLDQELEHALDQTGGPDADSPAVAAPVAAPKAKPKKGNVALLIALVAMAGGVAALFLVGFKEAAVYAMHADEVVAKADTLNGKRLRVEGELVPGTLVQRDDGCEYRFRVQVNKVELPIRFAKCVIPDTFRDRPEGGVMVTVEGELVDGGKLLEATSVMAKCASKYDPETKEMVNPDGSRVKASAAPPGLEYAQ
ncbi:MAG: cytochrome c maturation protein CcmE [Myxococcales bacterium]|nr:cytochrome c maturation protein CcmE [Myxococcales bacterium]